MHLTAREEYRLKFPALRPGRDQEPQRISWNAALDTAAERFAEGIRAHGPDAVAFYISGQLMTEDYYVFNKLAKGLIGTNNVDTNSRLCMSSAVELDGLLYIFQRLPKGIEQCRYIKLISREGYDHSHFEKHVPPRRKRLLPCR